MVAVPEDTVVGTCTSYLQTFCADEASRRRYRHVFRLLFVSYLGNVPAERFQRIVDAAVPMYETLADLDERLSTTSAGDGRTRNKRKHFTQEEVDRLLSAQTRCIDRLVIVLLQTTGLRRRGLLNILIQDVATHEGRWVAANFGRTLTKGAKCHEFRLFPLARRHIEEWLNTPHTSGGRPPSPSPFLFPSGRTDDGQMSVSALTTLFRSCCRRAGLGPHCHNLHAIARVDKAITTQKNTILHTRATITCSVSRIWATRSRSSKPSQGFL